MLLHIIIWWAPIQSGELLKVIIGQEYSILEIAEIVVELVGSNSKIIFEPLPEDDPKQRQPDIPLAKSKLDWKPKTHLKEGLEKTIQYFDQILTS